ncbi:DUF2160 domain-containing protein [Castellaniella sp.]|uniref:DUF2160 domain-containing protein n=1 Tax=Castellaniella sp. TaxID=1955812 RepID=UPI0035608D48
MLDWMVWTLPTAVFFICIALMLAVMTIWEIRSPCVMRKGFLPIPTTRGDRLFIGLLVAAYINLAFLGLGEVIMEWLELSDEPSLWISVVVSAAVLVLIMRRG